MFLRLQKQSKAEQKASYFILGFCDIEKDQLRVCFYNARDLHNWASAKRAEEFFIHQL